MKKIGSPEIQVVLNGGSEVLNSATIPVEWHLSEKIVDAEPQYIIVGDITLSLDKFQKEEYMYLPHDNCKVFTKATELVGYVQVFKPGVHSFLIYVVCGKYRDNAFEEVKEIQSNNVWYKDVLTGNLLAKYPSCSVYVMAVQFEVPEGFFQKKPEKGFQKLVWNWVNRWYD